MKKGQKMKPTHGGPGITVKTQEDHWGKSW